MWGRRAESSPIAPWQWCHGRCCSSSEAGQGGLGRRLQLAKLDMGPSHWAWVVFPASCPTLVTATNNLKSALQKKCNSWWRKKKFSFRTWSGSVCYKHGGQQRCQRCKFLKAFLSYKVKSMKSAWYQGWKQALGRASEASRINCCSTFQNFASLKVYWQKCKDSNGPPPCQCERWASQKWPLIHKLCYERRS